VYNPNATYQPPIQTSLRFASCRWIARQFGGPENSNTILPSMVEYFCPPGSSMKDDNRCLPAPGKVGTNVPQPDCPCVGKAESGSETPLAGNPIMLSTGAKIQSETDYETADGLLSVTRRYSSIQRGVDHTADHEIPGFGGAWHGIVPGRLVVSQNTTYFEYMSESGGIDFFREVDNNRSAFTWPEQGINRRKLSMVTPPTRDRVQYFIDDPTVANGPGEIRLDMANGEYIAYRRSDVYREYADMRYLVPVEHGYASGYKQFFDYPDNGEYPSKMRDSLGRELLLTWQDVNYYQRPFQLKVISQVALPDGTKLNYGYDFADPYAGSATPQYAGGGTPDRLRSVRRVDAGGAVLWGRNYLYENNDVPFGLTGVLDQNGARLSTYSYTSSGHAASTEGAGGVNKYTAIYYRDGPDAVPQKNLATVVTGPLGQQEMYRFTLDVSAPRGMTPSLNSVEGAATATVPAYIRSNAYTSTNGYDLMVSGMTDDKGNVAIHNVDTANRRPNAITEGVGTSSARTTNIIWHPTFDLPTQETRGQLQINYTYDSKGQLLSRSEKNLSTITVPYSALNETRTTTFTWNANSKIASINGPLAINTLGKDDVVQFVYDASANLTSITNGLGQATLFSQFDANGRPATSTDPNGIITAFIYDQLGRTTKVTRKHPTNTSLDAITTFDYDIEGRVTGITAPATDKMTMAYDLAGRLLSVSAPNGEKIEYGYDAMSNVTSQITKRSDTTTAESITRTFDSLGRMLTQSLGLNRTMAYEYDKLGNITKTTTPRTNVTTSGFDALNRLISTVAPDTSTTGFAYDSLDDVTSFTDPVSVATTFVRNGFGEVVQETSPDRGATTYYYDLAGRVTASIDARGQRVDISRDILGRVTKKLPVGKAAEVINYVWDSAGIAGSYGIGRMATMTDASGTTKFGYDHRGNMTSKVQAIGTSTAAALSYTYDLSDRITAMTYPSGRIVYYARDSKGRVAEISTRASAAAPLVYLMANTVYESFGALKQAGFGNGMVLLQDWGNDGRLALKQLYRSSDNGAISSFAYAYDYDDNMTGITDQITAANSLTYAYDTRGRLVRATAAATSSAAYKRQDFAYDANGNRTAVTWRTNAGDASAAATDTYTRSAGKNRLASITATAGTGATTAAGTRSFTHDARGNLSAESRPNGTATPTSVTTAYDGYGRLKTYSRSAGITNQNMVYNGMDDRVAQSTTGGTVQARYVYDTQGRMLGDYLAGATAAGTRGEYIYINPDAANDNASPYGGDDGMGGYGLLAVATKDAANAPVIHYIHSNHLGVPILTLSSTGAVIAAGTYTQPVFPGQMKTYADLYYNRYRDYDPTTGRYIQADPIGLAGGDNPYLYAEGNPVRYVDPMGLNPVTLGRTAVAAGELVGEGLWWWCRSNPAACMRTIGVAAIRVSKACNSIGKTISVVVNNKGEGDRCVDGWLYETEVYCPKNFKGDAYFRCLKRAGDRLRACKREGQWPPSGPRRWSILEDRDYLRKLR
jgi:RHS repeat-associated protein